MADLVKRFKDWRGPTKRELLSKIVHLEELQRKFGKRVSSGVNMGWGEFQYDPNTKFHGADKYDVFDQMEADPHIKGLLLDRTLPLLTAEWEIKPAGDKPKDIEIAEFCAANLLRQPSDRFGREYWLQTSWKAQRLPEILSMLQNGFALFVSSWKRVGTKVVYDRLQWIEPTTIDGSHPWDIDDEDNILAVNRKLTTPTERFLYDEKIPADRLKLYTWDVKGARYEGRSFIRAMYGPWYRKDFMQRMAIIWAQKVGAPVPIGHYPNGWDTQTIAKFRQFVESLRGEAPAEAYGMFPKSAEGTEADVRYAGAETGEVDRMGALIQGENREIHQGGRDSAAMLGETSFGSRALGESKGKAEIAVTQAIAEVACEWENHGVANLTGTLEELVNRNYTVKSYPELVCSKIDPFQNFDETIEAWKAGIIPKHEDARRQICEGTLGINLPDDAYEVEEPPPFVPGQPQPGGGAVEQPDDDGDEDAPPVAASLESAEDFRKRIAPLLEPTQEGRPKAGGFRHPNRIELEVCDLTAVSEAYRVGEQDVKTTLRAIRRDMTNDLMGRLRAGKINTRNLESQRRSKFRKAGKAKDSLLADIKRVGEQGMAHVRDEIKRQGGR